MIIDSHLLSIVIPSEARDLQLAGTAATFDAE